MWARSLGADCRFCGQPLSSACHARIEPAMADCGPTVLYWCEKEKVHVVECHLHTAGRNGSTSGMAVPCDRLGNWLHRDRRERVGFGYDS